MAKDSERESASELYIQHKKTAKEISILLKVSEKTVGKWVSKGKWKDRRDALMSSQKSGLENISKLIDLYSAQLLEMERDTDADPKEKFNKANSIAALRKTKTEFESNSKIPYATYIIVADSLMSDMVKKLPTLKADILDFFEEHLIEVSTKY
jgi:hypothetical protein